MGVEGHQDGTVGKALDVLDMQPALAVAELDHLAQNAHQHGGVLLPLTDLLRQQRGQPPPTRCVTDSGHGQTTVTSSYRRAAVQTQRSHNFFPRACGCCAT